MFGNSVILAQMPFGLIPKVFDAIDVIMLVRKELTVIDTIVLKLGHIQGIVRTIILSGTFSRMMGRRVYALASGITFV
jgi:hypothetical protein